MVLNVAFAKRSRWNNRNPVGRISGTRHPALFPRHRLPDGGFALSGLQKRAYSDTGAALYLQYNSAGVVSPLKSANRSVNDKVWTPWMADRGEPRQGASPRRGEQVESSRPQSGTREVSAVRSTDFLAGPRGLTRGARPLPLSRSPHKRLMKLPNAW